MLTRDLIASLDYSAYILFVSSYLLSPSHLITLVLRVASQAQFNLVIASPSTTRPHRSLRLYLTSWFAINVVNIVWHLVQGSRGTKSIHWTGSAIFLDFVGQASTPSTLHLVLIDLLIAIVQFALIVISFAEREAARSGTARTGRHSTLLGDSDDEDWSDIDDDNEEEEDGELLSTTKPLEPSNKPIVDIRLRAVWKEVTRRERSREGEGHLMRDMEEGRSPARATVEGGEAT